MPDSLALVASWVVPVNPEGEVLERHAVVMEDDRIAEVLPAADLDSRWPDIERVELDRHALIPGLINAHTHNAMCLLRGLGSDTALMSWLRDHIWPVEQRWVGREFVRDGSELAMLEMLRGGTTCFNDNYFFPDITAAVAIKAGMRGVIGLPVISVPTAWADGEDEYFERGLEVHQELKSEALVSTAFAPHAPYSVTEPGFRRIARLAEEMDVPVHLHLLETAGEIGPCLEQHGLEPLAYMEKLGLLGPRLIAVHMTQLDERDMDQVARAGVNVVHCPESNLKLASGICPVAELDRRGVNVAVGTDGAASNNDLDMFGEMRLAALLAKGFSGDAQAVPAPRALAMATINGARALGLESQIGSIEAGKQADLVAVDLGQPETQPLHDVIAQLVYAAARCQVTDVWVAGRRVIEDRRATTLDENDIVGRAEYWRGRLSND